MIVRQYIKDFEKMGLGMFVHFGIYSILGKGEWVRHHYPEYQDTYEDLAKEFCPDPQWAVNLVAAAKEAGCKYITITTRHHDGYSLYDTCGLNDYDAPHSCGRDLIREFVDACNAQGIIPFFYHTLIDWYAPDYPDNWQGYLQYLLKSVELLCKNYGKIGGIWFDGYWAHPADWWPEDELYGLIRSYQPEAMIINNTGLSRRGELGHIELDSVTFERGKPQPINMEGAPKYVASEMCEVMAAHWGYAEMDLDYKAPAYLIEELAECRRYGANMLLNVGPMPDGNLRPIDRCYLEILGKWVEIYGESIRAPRPSGIPVESDANNFLLRDGNTLYLFALGMGYEGSVYVALQREYTYRNSFCLKEKIVDAVWMNDGSPVEFTQNGDQVQMMSKPFRYGETHVVRVAKLTCA